MPKGFKIVFYVLLVLIGLWLILQTISYIIVSRSLPKTKGKLEFAELQSEVNIYRCGYHIPHILAENERDLFFSQGYITAQDRLWQMDLWRRIAKGELAEIFGKPGLASDSLMRTIGIGRTAKRIRPHLSQEIQNTYQAYANGVNACMQEPLPFEFMILQYKPTPWEIEDCIAISRWLAWEMTSQWKTEALLSNIFKTVGPEKSKLFLPEHIVLSHKQVLNTAQETPFAKVMWNPSNALIAKCSNGWVISGERTSTGKPLLAVDPHMALTSPSIFYEVHLDGGDFHVQGLALPGLPGVVIGQNQHIAWGLTNLMADDQDLYIEKVDPTNPTLFFFDGKWESMTIIKEKIAVKDDSSITMEIYETQNGPVISDFLNKETDLTISLKWTGLDIGDEGLAYYKINKAKNWIEFREALKAYCTTPQHFLFTDKEGNIGVQAAGAVPVRYGNTLLPRPGHDPQFQWKGTISFTKMPSIFNPEEKWIITANYPFGDMSKDNISTLWPLPWRNDRIQKCLSEKETLSIQDCQTIQTDIHSQFTKNICQWVFKSIELQEKNDEEKHCAEFLEIWDGQLRTGSAAAAFSQVLIQKLIDNIFQDEIGQSMLKDFAEHQNILLQALNRIRQGENPKWFDNISTQNVQEAKDEILLTSFKEAIEFLKENVHLNPDKWSWGELHKLTFKHPFGDMPLFDRLFNVGPFPVGGSGTSINCFGYLLSKPYQVAWGPGARIVFDLTDPDNSVSVLPTGQSGQFQDEHYNDQTPLFLGNMFHPMLMDTSKIRQSGWDQLHLVPGGYDE